MVDGGVDVVVACVVIIVVAGLNVLLCDGVVIFGKVDLADREITGKVKVFANNPALSHRIYEVVRQKSFKNLYLFSHINLNCGMLHYIQLYLCHFEGCNL